MPCLNLDAFLTTFSTLIHVRDPYTGLHSDRVCALAVALGATSDLSAEELRVLQLSAVLHDIGKIGVPDHILFKPTELTLFERDCARSHSVRGQTILGATNAVGSTDVGLVIRHHHEHYDGGGYPDQLAGESIPVLARIISVVDSYDAMSVTRVYNQAKTHEEVMRVLAAECGSKLDPYFFRKFESIIRTSPYRTA